MIYYENKRIEIEKFQRISGTQDKISLNDVELLMVKESNHKFEEYIAEGTGGMEIVLAEEISALVGRVMIQSSLTG